MKLLKFRIFQPKWSFQLFLIFIVWTLVNIKFILGVSYVPWDSIDEFYPQVKFVADTIRSGQLPWWNPWMYGGQPVLGDPQGMIFTPYTLAAIVLGDFYSLHTHDLVTIFMQLLGGCALALYSRKYTSDIWPPVLGALIFMAGGVATSRLQHSPQVVSYCLLPFFLLAFYKISKQPSFKSVAALTLVATLGLLNLNQVTFLTAIALAPIAFWHAKNAENTTRVLFAASVALLISLALTSPVWASIIDFVQNSSRSKLPLEFSKTSSFPFANLASLFLPGLYGIMSPENGLWAPTDSSQDFLYIGIIPTIILIAATTSAATENKKTAIIICLLSAVFWYIFAMGTNTPVYPFIFEHIYGMANFRRPADAAYFLNFFVALSISLHPCLVRFHAQKFTGVSSYAIYLCAVFCILLIILSSWRLSIRANREVEFMTVAIAFLGRVALIALFVAVLHSVRHRIPTFITPSVLLLLCAADIYAAGRSSAFFAPRVNSNQIAQIYNNDPKKMQEEMGLRKIINFLDKNGVRGSNPQYRVEAIGGGLGGSMPIAFQIMSIPGYSPISLSSYDKAVGAQNLQSAPKEFKSTSPFYDSELYRRLGLKYILISSVVLENLPKDNAMRMAAENITLKLSEAPWAQFVGRLGDYNIWETTNAHPRAELLIKNQKSVRCQIRSYEPTLLEVECPPSSQGLLVVGDNFAPGWVACTSKGSTEVKPYIGIFRSVELQSAITRVRFEYQAVPFLRHKDCH